MAKTTRENASTATDWDRLEAALTASTVRGRRGPAVPRELEGFDEAELAVLRRLATRARLSRSRAGGAARGNVVFLHGITGADLETVSGSDRDKIWINLARLIAGRIERLKLSPDAAAGADTTCRVVAARPNKRYYARGILSLRGRAGTPSPSRTTGARTSTRLRTGSPGSSAHGFQSSRSTSSRTRWAGWWHAT